ncbi:MAG: efflux RND transporter permease subunit, partial [Sedimentisphaerales bacterium]
MLKPRDQWRAPDKEALKEDIRKALADIPGVNFGFTQPIEMRVSEMLTGVRGDLAVKLYGSDLGVLNQKAEQIAQTLRAVPGAEDVLTTRNEGVQYLRIEVDRTAAGRLGLTVDALEDLLRGQIEGLPTGIVQEGIQRTPLLLRGPADQRADPSSLATMPVTLADGKQVPLSTVAKLERVEGVVSVQRELGNRFVVVRANVRGRDLVGFVDEAKAAVAKQVKLPTGYSLAWGGQFENQQRAAKRLSIVVPVALGLIFLLL